jgi:hypothetical protein
MPENISEAFDAGALTGKRNLFDHVVPDILRDGVKVTLVDSFLYEAVDLRAVVLCRHRGLSRSVKL